MKSLSHRFLIDYFKLPMKSLSRVVKMASHLSSKPRWTFNWSDMDHCAASLHLCWRNCHGNCWEPWRPTKSFLHEILAMYAACIYLYDYFSSILLPFCKSFHPSRVSNYTAYCPKHSCTFECYKDETVPLWVDDQYVAYIYSLSFCIVIIDYFIVEHLIATSWGIIWENSSFST